MTPALDERAPLALAQCRRTGTLSRIPLHLIESRAAAEAFQAAAVEALAGERCGYKIGATSVEVQRLLGCQGPMHAPILREHVLASGASFQLPAGLLGVECEFGFRIGRDFPIDAEAPNLAGVRAAVAECFVALELVGRRIAADLPLNEASALADFALDVAVVQGGAVADWAHGDLAAMPVRAVLDGVTVAQGTGAMVLGHPLNALVWLAEALRERGGHLRAGDIVLTGTCTGISKVAPGQYFLGCFADLPPVTLRLA